MSQAFGNACGFVLPAIFVKDDMEKEEFKRAMFWMVVSCAVLGVCQTLFNIAIYQKEPKTVSENPLDNTRISVSTGET